MLTQTLVLTFTNGRGWIFTENRTLLVIFFIRTCEQIVVLPVICYEKKFRVGLAPSMDLQVTHLSWKCVTLKLVFRFSGW